ncbi:MAG: efflux RND transporter periplasmic adaptor subunit [Anaerolineales bacterium]|nr:efflux RND transporter periplasmic adaptor subunit [Anaerolineales bacterium]
MNWKRLGIGIVILAVLGGAGFWGYTQFLAPDAEEPAEAVDVNAVSVDTGVDLVAAEGVVLPLADANLSFQTGGQLVEVLVEEGDDVDAGTPLLKLDSIDQEIAVTQAQAAVTQAQANIETAESGLLAAQTGLEAAQIGVTSAQAQLALTQAGPTAAQIALSEKSVAAADAVITQAAGSRDAAVEEASSAEVSAAQAQLQAAQAQYDAALKSYQPILQSDKPDDDVREQAQLQLNAALANLQSAQANLDEVLAGAKAGERTAAAAGVQVAVNQRDAAQAQLDLLLTGAKPEQIAIAEAGVTQAEAAVTEAELRLASAETAVEQANAALTEAEAALAAAQSALEKRTLTAPFAGTVASIPVKVGQVVSPGVPVLMMADMTGWQIETTDLTELSVVTIEKGFDVDVTIDAFPGETFSGQVTDISSVSDLVRGDVTYVVTVALDNNVDAPLRWGMTAFITIDSGQS